MEAIGKLLEHLGYAAPLLYAAAAYGLFHWLDENLSDAAKSALARTMKLKDYGKEQVASALVEVFDRIYARPLLSWRAFLRSLLFTTVVSVIYVFEAFGQELSLSGPPLIFWVLLPAFLFNVFTDYLSLFVIRTLLTRSGTKAVTGLVLGALGGVAIVFVANALRGVALLLMNWNLVMSAYLGEGVHDRTWSTLHKLGVAVIWHAWNMGAQFIWPAIAVFTWLPLLALGILAIRALTPLSLIVAQAQWALKEGDKHPLKATGCVAAVAVFAVTVGLRAVFAGA
jgi:hypothetical protein